MGFFIRQAATVRPHSKEEIIAAIENATPVELMSILCSGHDEANEDSGEDAGEDEFPGITRL